MRTASTHRPACTCSAPAAGPRAPSGCVRLARGRAATLPAVSSHPATTARRAADAAPAWAARRRGGMRAAAASAEPQQAADAPVALDGCILGTGALGSWDEAAVGFPVVRCFVGDDEQRWFMWYSGRGAAGPAAGSGVDAVAPGSGSVGVAVSRDGVNWVRGGDAIAGERGAGAAADVGSVMSPNGDWWTFDTCHLAPSDVQVLSNSSVSSGVGVYWMFYTGGDYEPVALPEGFPGAAEAVALASASLSGSESGSEGAAGDGGAAAAAAAMEGLRLRPGLAMSQDGRNWARIEADHHTGALFDTGDEGDADELFVGSPQVLAVGPRDMRMYYTSWDTKRRRFVVLLATSPDGFKWTKRGLVFDTVTAAAGAGTAFDALGAANVSVVRDVDNRQFLMFYEAVAADNRRSIGLAVSADGTTWRRHAQPVLTPAPLASADASASAEAEANAEAWDGGDVGAPCAVSMSAGRWRLYYAGRQRSGPGPWQGIGLALSVEEGPKFEGVPVQYRRKAPPKPQQGEQH